MWADSFAHLFARSEPREQAAKVIRGLLNDVKMPVLKPLDSTSIMLYNDHTVPSTRSLPALCSSLLTLYCLTSNPRAATCDPGSVPKVNRSNKEAIL